MPNVAMVIAVILGVILASTGLPKLLRPHPFRASLVSTYGLSSRLATVLTWAIPGAELVAAGLTILPETRWVGFAGSATLLASFGLGASRAIVQGRSGDCGCFGELAPQPLSQKTVARAFALALLATFGFAVAVAPVGAPTTPGAAGIALALFGVVLAIVVITSTVRLMSAAGGSWSGRLHD